MSKFTLSIQNKFNLPVKFTMKEGDVNKLHSFTLEVERRDVNEIKAFTEDGDRSIIDILQDLTKGWSGQRFVMDGDEPAEFSKEAYQFMLEQSGVAMRIWELYLKECGAKAKN
jgi:hypothetical protein